MSFGRQSYEFTTKKKLSNKNTLHIKRCELSIATNCEINARHTQVIVSIFSPLGHAVSPGLGKFGQAEYTKN